MSDRDPKRILYGVGSPNVRKVMILLDELGLDYALRHVAVFAGEQFAPEFLALNPLGKVPVLIDPSFEQPLFESGAILFNLAEAYGEFMPAEGWARAEVMQWLMVQMGQVGPILGQYNHFRVVMAETDQPYAAARYRNHSKILYAHLDNRLRDREWIAGDAYSIADMAIFPWMLYLEVHGFSAGDYPALARWREAIGQRPAVIQSGKRLEEIAPIADKTRRAATPRDLDRFFARPEDGPPADFSPITR